MRMFRSILVFLTCALFASAAVASTHMQCCAESARQQEAQQDKALEALPCHSQTDDGGGQDTGKPSYSAKGCQCLGTAQVTALPEPSAPLRVAFDNDPAVVPVFPYPDIPFAIDAPPKAHS